MDEIKNSESNSIIAQNKEEWGRLMFLLQDPEPNVFWVNCDTAFLKRPLHDLVTEYFPKLEPYDIYINEKTESLNRIIFGSDKDKISSNNIIHVFGLEDAAKSTDFVATLNFQRDSLFRKTPAHIIFWADFPTGTVLSHKAYDFWSWVLFTFDFNTPQELLSSRQKGFQTLLTLEDTTIQLPHKDSAARISHLEGEWDEFLKSVNGKPGTIKQMKDAVTIARALAMEYKNDGKDANAIKILECVLNLGGHTMNDKDENLVWNDLGISYVNLGVGEKAKDLFEKALSGNIKFLGDNHYEVAVNKSNLAMAYKLIEKKENAIDLLEDALHIIENYWPEKVSYLPHIQSNLATIYGEGGELDKAKDLLEKALSIEVENFGDDSSDAAIKMSNLGTIYYYLKDFRKAIDLFESALKSDLKNFGKFHPNTFLRYFNLGVASFELGETSQAFNYMVEAYEIAHKIYGEDDKETKNVQMYVNNFRQL